MASKKTKKETPPEKIIAFKAFDPDFSCRGFKYEVGKTYKHEGDVSLCASGFHACKEPLEVWRFYDLINGDGRMARYAEVEMGGKIDGGDGPDTKIAAAEITIKAELKLPDFIRRAVSALIDACKSDERVQAASGDSSKLAASGNASKLAASGRSSTLATSGDSSTLAASGHSSTLAASGYSSKLAASGHSSTLAASGNYSTLAASGHDSKLAASGYSSKLAASGHSSRLAADGENGVIATSAPGCAAKGKVGTWISLAEFNDYGKCVGFATGCVGENGIKADTFYRAAGGKLVEA